MNYIGRTLARSFHHVRALGAPAAQRIFQLRSRSRWEQSTLVSQRVLLPFCALHATAFATAGSACIRVHAQDDAPSAEEIEPEKPVEIDKRSDGPILQSILYIVMNWMDRSTTLLACAVVSVNALISASFRLGFYMNEPPKPKPALIRFLCKNFVLSQGWLRRHRWHGLLTSIFTHLSAAHLVRNSAMTFLCIMVSSEFLSATEIARLFLAGGLIGKTVSISLCRALRKDRYLAYHVGGSDGVYALLYFSCCAMESDTSREWLTFFRALLCYNLLRDAVGFRKFIRYGHTGKGNAFGSDHAAHLAGALTGFAAHGWKYLWTPMVLEFHRKDDIDDIVSSREKTSS